MSAPTTDVDEHERYLALLDELDAALEDNIERSRSMQHRLRSVRRRVDAGAAVADVIADEPTPRTVEMLSENIETLHGIGARLRAAQALALRAEGLTIASIADLFGVTRQRVSALLRQKAAASVAD